MFLKWNESLDEYFPLVVIENLFCVWHEVNNSTLWSFSIWRFFASSSSSSSTSFIYLILVVVFTWRFFAFSVRRASGTGGVHTKPSSQAHTNSIFQFTFISFLSDTELCATPLCSIIRFMSIIEQSGGWEQNRKSLPQRNSKPNASSYTVYYSLSLSHSFYVDRL